MALSHDTTRVAECSASMAGLADSFDLSLMEPGSN